MQLNIRQLPGPAAALFQVLLLRSCGAGMHHLAGSERAQHVPAGDTAKHDSQDASRDGQVEPRLSGAEAHARPSTSGPWNLISARLVIFMPNGRT